MKFTVLIYPLLFCSLFSIYPSWGQSITTSVPKEIDSSVKYLFYLHGGVVQSQGVNAVSRYYGPYKYLEILEVLNDHGYHVISEVRPKNTQETEYAKIVAMQIDTLMGKGVPAHNIVIVGASLGAYIAVETAIIKKDKNIKYALLGLCSDYAIGYFEKYVNNLCGNFLSIYERSDEKGSCQEIFREPACKKFEEIELDMGNSHAFLFKPFDEWVMPLVDWIEER